MSVLAGYLSRSFGHPPSNVPGAVYLQRALLKDRYMPNGRQAIPFRNGTIILQYETANPISQRCFRTKQGHIAGVLGFLMPSEEKTDALGDIDELPVGETLKRFQALEGEYVAVLADGENGVVHLINDRFASRPFYVMRAEDAIYFGSDLAFLLRLCPSRPAMDPLGLLQMFELGHTIDQRTTFRDIRRLRPASHTIISREGVHEEQYWSFEHRPDEELRPRPFAEEVFGALQTSAKHRLAAAQKGILALSGGADSRLVAAAFPQRERLRALTWVIAPTSVKVAEAETASKVAARLGLEHDVEIIPEADLPDFAADLVRLTGGVQSIDGPISQLHAIAAMKRMQVRCLFGGGPGDVHSGGYTFGIPSDLRGALLTPTGVDACTRYFCRVSSTGGIPVETLSRVIRRDLLEDYYPQLEKSLLESFHDVRGPTFAHRLTAWAMTRKQPGADFCNPIRSYPGMTDSFVLLGYRYVDLMLRLPAHWLYKRNFYNFMLYHCLPDLRTLKFANSSATHGARALCEYRHPLSMSEAMVRSKRYVRHLAAMCVGERTLKAMKRTATSRHATQTRPFWYDFFRRNPRWENEIKEILHASGELAEIVDVRGCLQFLDDFKGGKLERSETYQTQTRTFARIATLCSSFRDLGAKWGAALTLYLCQREVLLYLSPPSAL